MSNAFSIDFKNIFIQSFEVPSYIKILISFPALAFNMQSLKSSVKNKIFLQEEIVEKHKQSVQISINQKLPERQYLINSTEDDHYTLNNSYGYDPLRFMRTEVHQTIFNRTFLFLTFSRHFYEPSHPCTCLVYAAEVGLSDQFGWDFNLTNVLFEMFFSPETDEDEVVIIERPLSD